MKEEKIMTLHPAGKNGVNILKRRYDIISDFIIKTIKEKKEITFQELTKLAEVKLKNKFDGKIVWYMVTVKLDLEARKTIKQVGNKKPQTLRLFE
jgi:hypothetical protein